MHVQLDCGRAGASQGFQSDSIALGHSAVRPNGFTRRRFHNVRSLLGKATLIITKIRLGHALLQVERKRQSALSRNDEDQVAGRRDSLRNRSAGEPLGKGTRDGPDRDFRIIVQKAPAEAR
ncbi:MAG: hypothetical protein JWR80_2739 [Bradyrhizobium sp.]|nr:hypothetical protein [Bradyrhizobium sp.]